MTALINLDGQIKCLNRTWDINFSITETKNLFENIGHRIRRN